MAYEDIAYENSVHLLCAQYGKLFEVFTAAGHTD